MMNNPEILSTFERRSSQYGTAMVQGVLRRENDTEWRNCFTMITFLDTGGAETENVLDYGSFVYVESRCSVQSARQIMDTLIDAGVLHVMHYKVSLLTDTDLPAKPSHSSFVRSWGGEPFRLEWPTLEWPTTVYYFRTTRNVASPANGRLVGLGKPLYPNGYRLIEDKMGVDLEQSNGLVGVVAISLPDYRAKISEVQVGIQSIEIKVIPGQMTNKELIAKVYARNKGMFFHDERRLENEVEVVHVGFSPTEVEVCLLTLSDGELLDERTFNPYAIALQSPTEELNSESVQRLVLNGEGPFVEFKPGTKDERAKEEWAETAIAFANKDGGIILIGVSDKGEIKGFFGDGLDATVRDSIRGRTEPPLEVDVHNIVVDDKPVYWVRVPKGVNKPFARKEKGILYIRSGSTDRRMTRYELDEIYGRNSSGTGQNSW